MFEVVVLCEVRICFSVWRKSISRTYFVPRKRQFTSQNNFADCQFVECVTRCAADSHDATRDAFSVIQALKYLQIFLPQTAKKLAD